MNFLLKSCRGDFMIPIQTPEKLLTHPAFDTNAKTAILVTGWFSNVNSTMENDALTTVWEAYKCRNDMNFIVSVMTGGSFGKNELVNAFSYSFYFT